MDYLNFSKSLINDRGFDENDDNFKKYISKQIKKEEKEKLVNLSGKFLTSPLQDIIKEYEKVKKEVMKNFFESRFIQINELYN